MCAEAAWAIRSSIVSHFSMTAKLSSPSFACQLPTPSMSMTALYSMQPFSASTAGTFALKAARTSSRLPGFAVIWAITLTGIFIIPSLMVVDFALILSTGRGESHDKSQSLPLHVRDDALKGCVALNRFDCFGNLLLKRDAS